MAKVTFITADDESHVVDAAENMRLMQVAVNNSISGIDGDCGGNAACATCHVYVDPSWTQVTGHRTEEEQAMLECTQDVRENSRLSCQILVTGAMDGLVVRVAGDHH